MFVRLTAVLFNSDNILMCILHLIRCDISTANSSSHGERPIKTQHSAISYDDTTANSISYITGVHCMLALINLPFPAHCRYGGSMMSTAAATYQLRSSR